MQLNRRQFLGSAAAAAALSTAPAVMTALPVAASTPNANTSLL